MSGDAPHRDRPVRFTLRSDERFGKWAESASAEDYDLVGGVLLRVVDGTWRSECDCYQNLFNALTWHILIKRGLIVTVRFPQEYPDRVQLLYIGPP